MKHFTYPKASVHIFLLLKHISAATLAKTDDVTGIFQYRYGYVSLCENPRAINQDSLNIEGLIADHINIFSLETIGQHS